MTDLEDSRCHRRRRRDPARRSGRGRRSGTTSRRADYAISEVDPARWDPGAVLRPRSAGAREDVLEDRRLGPRLGVGSARLAAPDPADASATRWTTRRSGRSPARGWRSPTTGWPERPLDLERTAVILGNAMSRREALPAPRCGSPSPSSLASSSRRRQLRGAVRRCAGGDRSPSCTPTSMTWLPGDHRGHDAG